MISIQDFNGERVVISTTDISCVREVPDSIVNSLEYKTTIMLSDGQIIKTNELLSSIIERVLKWQFKWERYRALAQAWAQHAGSVLAEDQVLVKNLCTLMDELEEELKNLALK